MLFRSPGDIHIIPQGMPLAFRLRGPTELLVLSFDQTTLLAVAPSIAANPEWQLAPHFCLRDSQITSLLHAVRDAVHSGCANGDPHVRNLGNVLLHYLATHYSKDANIRPAPAGGLPPRRLRSALEYIHSHLSSDPDELNLSRIAEAAGMRPQH